MENKRIAGVAMAAAAAALFVAGCASQGSMAAKSAQVQCMGVNACKGQSACKTAASSCKGQNSCKGQGWLEMSADDCKAKGGKAG